MDQGSWHAAPVAEADGQQTTDPICNLRSCRANCAACLLKLAQQPTQTAPWVDQASERCPPATESDDNSAADGSTPLAVTPDVGEPESKILTGGRSRVPHGQPVRPDPMCTGCTATGQCSVGGSQAGQNASSSGNSRHGNGNGEESNLPEPATLTAPTAKRTEEQDAWLQETLHAHLALVTAIQCRF